MSIRPITVAARALLLMLAAAGASAQPTSPANPALDAIAAQIAQATREAQRHLREWAEELHDSDFDPVSLAFVASELGGRGTEIVKNAPYTAEAVNESTQLLSDGNRITKQSRTLLARDSFGRTRQERKDARGASVYVFDAIEGRSYALNPERRTVVRIPRVPVPPTPPNAPVPPVPPLPPVPPTPNLVPPEPRIEIAPGKVVVRKRGEGAHDDVHVEVLRIGRGDAPPHHAHGPWTLPLLPRGKGETRSLGTRDIGGVKAEGTQTTHTIAAGAIGNEKPIVITSERWFSPELHVVVLARSIDPRAGETTYRLENLRREEPPAELFKVPADYRTSSSRRN